MRVYSLILVAVLGATVAGEEPAAAVAGWSVERLEAPPLIDSAMPFLASRGDRDIWLSGSQRLPDGSFSLQLSKLHRDRWTAPLVVATGRDWFYNWADFPTIALLEDGGMAAHWLEMEAEGTYTYGVRVVRSSDGGKSWTKPITPHRDGVAAEHGFVSMVPLDGGKVGLAWLDGREMTGDDPGSMTLRWTTLAGDGELGEEVLLDPRTCECCQTDAIRLADGSVLVAYRDCAESGVRDIALVRRVNDEWSEPALVHADGWRIEGCPVNGPSMAGRGSHVAIAWFTMGDDAKARVLVARSEDSGRTFSTPVRIDSGSPLGRVDVVMTAAGETLVAWFESSGGEGELRVRTVTEGGALGDPISISKVLSGRISGFPRMCLVGNAVLVAWTHIGEDETDIGVVRLRSDR